MCTGMILSNYKLFVNPLFKLMSIEHRQRVNAAKRRRRRVRVDARSYKSTAAAITAVAEKRQAGAAAAKEVAIAEDANVNDILH